MVTVSSQPDIQPPPTEPHKPASVDRPVPFKKRLERWAGYLLVVFFQLLVRNAGPNGAAFWGAVLGKAFFRFCRRYREVALKNLRLVFPHWTERERCDLACRVLVNFGKSAVEFLRLPTMPEREFTERITLEGKEDLDAALAKGKGVLLVTAHFGNWELMSARLVREGYLLDALARDPELPATSKLLREIRESRTLYRVYPKTTLLPIARALKENRVVGIVADQHDFNGIVLDFLGHPARTPIGPAALALMTGAQLMPAFCYRKPDNTFHIRIYPAFGPEPTGDREADIARITKRLTEYVEDIVREMPDQWLWFHDRWRPEAKSALRAK